MKQKQDIVKIITAIYLCLMVIVPFDHYNNKRILRQPVVMAKEVEDTTPTPTPTLEPTTAPQKPQTTTDLINEIFGKDARVALAVAKAESGLTPTRENKSPVECSIGLYQINLAKDYCNGKWVHAGKVPGATMEEKIEWLKVPENNIRMAKKIHGASGFRPWSVFTNRSYLKHIEGGENN